MKGEYVDEKDHPSDMFAKLKVESPSPHHHFQLNSDETYNRSPTTTTAITPTTTAMKEFNSDGATIEVVRRPRGRPPGSKNKPKPPVFITREADPAMCPYFLEIPVGGDIVELITRFCRKNNTGLCVLSGSGAVANVSLRQPTAPGATVTFHGRFDLLSLSATILPRTAMPVVGNGFAISLAGPQGQIIGGTVVEPLFAAGMVYVIASSFNNPSFHRLAVEVEADARYSESAGKEGQLSPVASVGGDGGHPSGSVESCGMSVYSCHVAADVIRAPTARPQPHYG